MTGRAKTEIGNKYGRLTVLRRAGSDKYGHAMWVCRCDCGNEVTTRGTRLRSGKTQSCGCYQAECAEGQPAIDETGNEYGLLTVVARAGTGGDGRARWLCRCSCGNKTIVNGSHLRTGNTKSCGCLSGGSSLPEGVASMHALFGNYQRGAERRDLCWELSREAFVEITQQPCSYCGLEPSRPFRSGNANGAYVYNGIDRVDNDKGYTTDNTVSCCWRCNIAKHDMSVSEFEKWVAQVYKHLIEEG